MSLVFYNVDDPAIPTISVDEFLSNCLLVPRGFEYRGQGDKHWKLVPSAFRDSSGKTLDAVQRIKRLNYFFQDSDFEIDFKRLMGVAGSEEKVVISDTKGYKTLLMMAFFQHFGIPTPLIDWTSSPLIALFMSLFDRPPSANDVSIFRLDTSLLTDDVTFQQYNKLYFRRIQAQMGGVLFFGKCNEASIAVDPIIYSEYIASTVKTSHFVQKLDILIGPGDIEKIHNALTNNGFREDLIFPNSVQWVVKQLKDKMSYS